MWKSEPEMQQAATFVEYEWSQFSWAVSEIRRIPEFGLGTGRTEPFEDALIEVLLLHARALRDFFGRSRSELARLQETDTVAEDFGDTPGRYRTKPLLTYLEGDREYDRLNRALAHLSYDRPIYELTGKDWDFNTIIAELTAALDSFFAFTLPPDRSDWFGRHSAILA